MAVEKVNSSSSLAEVVDRILDKGIVIDAWIRISVAGIEFLTVEARVVVASVETYLKYAEAIGLTIPRDHNSNYDPITNRKLDNFNVVKYPSLTLVTNNVIHLATGYF